MSPEQDYFTDAEHIAEMRRLDRQGRAITKGVGRVPDQIPDISRVHDVLDLACGPGEWAMYFAQRYPEKQVTGVDISTRMIKYAQAQATVHHLPVTFRVMDVTTGLDFPDNSFDFVNVRFIMAFMLKERWPALLAEIMRVLRPGGFVRLCEQEGINTTDEQTARYFQWWCHAFHRAGHTFAQSPQIPGYCIGIMLKRLLQRAGFVSIEEFVYAIDMSVDTPVHADTLQTVADAFKVGKAFLLKYGPPGLKEKQLDEAGRYIKECIEKEDYYCYWHIITSVAQKPQ